jgi:hypothetical protein
MLYTRACLRRSRKSQFGFTCIDLGTYVSLAPQHSFRCSALSLQRNSVVLTVYYDVYDGSSRRFLSSHHFVSFVLTNQVSMNSQFVFLLSRETIFTVLGE